jgi:hypothetical protein
LKNRVEPGQSDLPTGHATAKRLNSNEIPENYDFKGRGSLNTSVCHYVEQSVSVEAHLNLLSVKHYAAGFIVNNEAYLFVRKYGMLFRYDTTNLPFPFRESLGI